MTEDLEHIKAILTEALDKETEAEQKAYLDEVCGNDANLRAEVESLLRSYSNAGDFLEASPFGPDITLDSSPLTEGPGTVIGRYKLLEQIGEGGMAVVYMAEQEEPIRRKVALKIIKLGMDTKQVIARFEVERQALAMMDHPNIAKVLDAGATERGRPYFVMELVTGVSITEYCDKNNLGTQERLALFIQVCNAVQHAHQKGIIHRDIKPSNVMVTHRDGTPVPKIIDFGIAKATRQRLTEKTLFTRYAHIIGTPAYMSPEQAELSDVDVDTRSDIYSLGVLLYELLTGTPPFGEEELRKAGYVEMQCVIREREPAKPSTKLSTLGETLTDVAKHRGSTPDLLQKAVRGDLDWIVMKTLEKTRDRRYETVSALALDVQRHLSDEPIFARAPSAMYRLHKFVRRHRSQSIVMLIVSVLLAALMIVLLMWNQNRLKVAKVESMAHQSILSEARLHFYSRDNPALAIRKLRPILDSKHVGYEAQLLHSNILTNAREQVSHYTSKIEDNPEDANNYFRRAQYHKYLGDQASASADMRRWSAVAGGGQPSDLLFGTPLDFRRVLSLAFDFELVFGELTNLGPPVSTSYQEESMCISSDGLELYFASAARPGGSGGLDLWVRRRATTQDEWDQPVNLGETVNSAGTDATPRISADGLELYFTSDDRPGGSGWSDIWVTTRATTEDDWGPPENLGLIVNTPQRDAMPCISQDGLTLYFASDRPGGIGSIDLWVTTRARKDQPWGEPENLGWPVNSSADEVYPSISADGLQLYFSEWALFRPGGHGHCDIWVATRPTEDAPWGQPANLGPGVNTPAGEIGPFISPDGSALYFCSNRPGGYGRWDIWQAPVLHWPDDIEAPGGADQAEILPKGSEGKEVVPDAKH